MSDDVFTPPAQVRVPVKGGGQFPVRRIFCIGRNYADHVKEMGGDTKTSPPTFFTKPADAVFTGGPLAYPLATQDFHYEGELVVALRGGGTLLDEEQARRCVFGYAAGCDFTRRDLQNTAKKTGSPWDAAKALDKGAGLGLITRAEDWHPDGNRTLYLYKNGSEKQKTQFSRMIWSVEEILIKLSGLFQLKAGDLIYTGTPQGVGPMEIGDKIEVVIEGLDALCFEIAQGQ